MRVALLSATARAGDAIGNQLAEKLAFFRERGADVRVFLDCKRRLHPAVRPYAAFHRDTTEVRRFLESADLAIVDYSQYFPLLDLLPALAGGRPRIVFDYHGVTPAEFAEDNLREILQQSARQRGLIWFADAAIVHSRFAERELLGPTGFPKDRVAQLGYPLDADWFCPGTPSRSLRTELGLQDALILLYVGRLARNKRVLLLIEALTHLREQPVHAVVIGDDTDIYQSERRRCEDRAAELGVADRLHFLGHVDDSRLRDAYRSADLFVMPSRHEGFCIPVLEAMACGLPVLAARAGALPETVGDAGLTFRPDDADDLARKVLLVTTQGDEETRRQGDKENAKRRVAVVACRYGPHIVGGAEASLRTIAESLQQTGHRVEVFATCMNGEHPWSRQSPEDTETIRGIRVRRFRLDPADANRHLAARQEIEQAGGTVPAEVERDYLANSARSSRLLAALNEQRDNFDAVIVGPYLTGLAFDVAQQFPEKTLLLPCFHDEPFAWLENLRAAYRKVGGILYHSPEEQQLAEIELGINHPGAVVCGTRLDRQECGNPQRGRQRVGGNRRYLLYCGRYSPHKNLPLLLDWARRYSEHRPGRFTFAFCGQGEFALPQADWLRDLGCLDRATQLDILAGADALVQLSRVESLSLAALEAWEQGVPVLAHADCPVLASHIERGGGGRTVADYQHFAAALDDLWERPEHWQSLGQRGRDYVNEHYGSSAKFTERLIEAIDDLSRPLLERMKLRGLERGRRHNRTVWRERFAELVEEWLDSPPPPVCERIDVEPRFAMREAAAGSGHVLLPVRVANWGSHAVVAEGSERAVLRVRVMVSPLPRYSGGEGLGVRGLSSLQEPPPHPQPLSPEHGGEGREVETPLPAMLLPGQTQSLAALVPVPDLPGDYAIRLRLERPEGNAIAGTDAEVRLRVTDEPRPLGSGFDRSLTVTAPYSGVQAALAAAAALQRLPDDYLDVTDGWFANCKRWLKRKLLHNFRRAYVDVLSRRQSAFNRHVLTALHELAETCAAQEERLATLLGSVAKESSEHAAQASDSSVAKTEVVES